VLRLQPREAVVAQHTPVRCRARVRARVRARARARVREI